MNKTILVIGSVTAKQYEQARLQLLRNGFKPKVMRASKAEMTLSTEDLISRYGSNDGSELVHQSPEWMRVFTATGKDDSMARRLVAKHLEQFGNIGAIVVADDCYDMIGLQDCAVSLHAGLTFEDVPMWRVHSKDYVEYMGSSQL